MAIIEMHGAAVSRNSPCPCGSGRKFKRCCLGSTEEVPARAEGTVPRLHSSFHGRKVILLGDFEEAQRLTDEGTTLLHAGDPGQAAQRLRAARREFPDHPCILNNLAIACHEMGEIAEAIRIEEDVLERIMPDNVFAMGSLVHYYLAAGRDQDARAMGDRLSATAPEDCFWFVRKCEGLARLRRHADILRAAEAYAVVRDDPRWTAPARHFFAGTACANLGQEGEARRHLERAVGDARFRERSGPLLDRLREGRGPGTLEEVWPYLDLGDWVPRSCIEHVLQTSGVPGSADDVVGQRADDEATARIRRWPLLAEAMLYVFDGSGGTSVAAVEMLGLLATPRALEILGRIADGIYGSDEARRAAMQGLIDAKVRDARKPCQIWQDGEWQEMSASPTEIREDATRELPNAQQALYERGVEALRRGDAAEAERLNRELLRKEPRAMPARHNLAAALFRLGREGEAVAALRENLKIDPSYLFSPAMLARILLRDGDVAGARATLDAVEMADAVHPDAIAEFLAARAHVELLDREGNPERAAGFIDTVRDLAPEHPVLRIPGTGFLLRVRRRAYRSARRLRLRRLEALRCRPLPERADAEACLAPYTPGQLLAIGLALGIPRTRGARGKIRGAIRSAMRDPDRVRTTVESLEAGDRDAFREVVAAGGSMRYVDFTRAHGTDVRDAPNWHRTPPGTLLGRLKSRGLLAEGTVRGVPSVLVPYEVLESWRVVCVPATTAGS